VFALGPILAKLAFNLLILVLRKTGVLTAVEADAVKTGDNMLRVVEHLKTYSAPDDFPTNIRNGGTAPN
jgi:hypothetical protein